MWLSVVIILPSLLTACLRQPAPASGVVLGTVTLQDGTPAAGAALTLQLEPSSGSEARRTTTADAEGRFRLEGVRVGVYWLTAQSGTTESALVTGVEVREAEETSVSVTLLQAGGLAGLALRGDQPQAGGVLASIAGTPFEATSGAGGEYRLDGVPSGISFDLGFSASGYAPAALTDVVAVAGEVTLLPDVTLERVAPYALFNVQEYGNLVEVDATDAYDPTGRVVRYLWDFGDGTRVEGGPEAVTLTHQYATSGTRTIRLTVVNDQGNRDTTSREVTITLPQLRVGAGPYAVTVPPRTSSHWDVVVPVGTRGDVLYFEVAGAESIEVRRGTNIYYSTQAGTFRRLASGAAASADAEEGASAPGLSPLAIGVGRACRGPCVLLPNSGGATLTVHNPGTTVRQVQVHLVAEAFDDLNEPNDVPGSATELGVGTDSGATELVGDVDWFRVTEAGWLTFDGPLAISLRATVHGADGASRTLTSGVPANVVAGDLVQVRALQPEAGPSGVTAYYLTLD